MDPIELFRRENPTIEGIIEANEDPRLKWPIYRHFDGVPERDAINDLDSVPVNDFIPTIGPSTADGGDNDENGSGDDDENGNVDDDENENGDDGVLTDDIAAPEPEEEDPFTCTYDDDGNFNAISSDFTDETLLTYKYKVETYGEGVNVENDIVPFLEKEILQMIVPEIFDCENGQGQSRHLRRKSRRLALSGASTFPADTISDEECTAEDEGTECNIVDGKMTLYTFESDEAELSAIQDLVCNALNSDSLAFEHPSITSLECIRDLEAPPSIIDNNRPTTTTAAAQGLAAPTLVLSSMAAVMFVFGVYFYRRRSNEDEDVVPEHKPHLDDSDINNSNSLSFEDLPMAWATQSKTATPAFDMTSIIPKGRVKPETIVECKEDEESSGNLDEVSLDQLNRNLDESDFS